MNFFGFPKKKENIDQKIDKCKKDELKKKKDFGVGVSNNSSLLKFGFKKETIKKENPEVKQEDSSQKEVFIVNAILIFKYGNYLIIE